MAEASFGQTIGPAVVLMGAAVVAVPLFRRIGLGSVLGYFAAGLLVGPSVLGLFTDAQSILHFSELGVVMFLFVIGLELRPQKLWAMRGQIFGLGLAQVAAAIAALVADGRGDLRLFRSDRLHCRGGLRPFLDRRHHVGAAGPGRDFERGGPEVGLDPTVRGSDDRAAAGGGRLPVAAVARASRDGPTSWWRRLRWWRCWAVSRWGLNPFFALLARARTREVLTAGALLVVLGAALLMDAAGLSMAMGAFLAGVMLSSSSYRHQIESDIEPFRGLLMGLFFLAVGMSLDLSVVAAEWRLLLSMLVAFTVAKGAVVYAVARLFGGSNHQALHRTSHVPAGRRIRLRALCRGDVGRRDRCAGKCVVRHRRDPVHGDDTAVHDRSRPLLRSEASMDGVDVARDLKGRILLIGFGRFGQIASQTAAVPGRRPCRHRPGPRPDPRCSSIWVQGLFRRRRPARRPAPLRRGRSRCDHGLHRRSEGRAADRGPGAA